ncbi:DUF2987 domain-containing protein [Agaribacter flavus]|uniref:DUF2987 domain-containing protein n=1 Tax=Agaribacter flavus TaxID=1902781 RepID=A0ABV7FQV9_9ALTE
MKRNFIFGIASGFALSCPIALVSAEEISVEYKRFYSHVRKLNNEETEALQFAFGFKHIHENRLCDIASAVISTDKKQIPLALSDEHRFTVPSEKALRLADARVVLDLQDKANLCDMSVQLETKENYLKTSYTPKELRYLFDQYHAFFDDMGGLLSFMMPSVVGLRFYFENGLNQQLENSAFVIVNGELTVDKKQFDNLPTLNLPSTPLRITAITSK